MYDFDPQSVSMVEWVGSALQPEPQRWNVSCASEAGADDPTGCYPVQCGRAVIDNFFTAAEVQGRIHEKEKVIVYFQISYCQCRKH